MKEEVPPPLIDAHVKMIQETIKDGQQVDATYGLEKSGIAGTAPEQEEGLCAFISLYITHLIYGKLSCWNVCWVHLNLWFVTG